MDFVKYIDHNFDKIVAFNKSQNDHLVEQFPEHKWLTIPNNIIVSNYTITNNETPMIYIHKQTTPSYVHNSISDTVGLFRIGGVYHTNLNMFCWSHNMNLFDKSMMYTYKDKYDNFKIKQLINNNINDTLYSICMAIQYLTGADLVCFTQYKNAITYELVIITNVIQ